MQSKAATHIESPATPLQALLIEGLLYLAA